jgi:hypothetical protein
MWESQRAQSPDPAGANGRDNKRLALSVEQTDQARPALAEDVKVVNKDNVRAELIDLRDNSPLRKYWQYGRPKRLRGP